MRAAKGTVVLMNNIEDLTIVYLVLCYTFTLSAN